MHTDNGSQYVNTLMATLSKLFNIKHQLSIAYSSQDNAICERANKEVVRHLQMLTVGQNRTESWSSFLPLVQRFMNSAIHTSTGHSPSQLMFGDAWILDEPYSQQMRTIHYYNQPTQTNGFIA
jgi:transposase InsO family protein